MHFNVSKKVVYNEDNTIPKCIPLFDKEACKILYVREFLSILFNNNN